MWHKIIFRVSDCGVWEVPQFISIMLPVNHIIKITIPFSVFTAFVEWIPFCRNPLRFFVTGAVPTEILEINFVPKT